MMKRREVYADLRALPPAAVRIDGRNFHRLPLEKPYDKRFARAMASTCEDLIKDSGLTPVLAYTFSDEINLLFYDLPYNGRVEKLDTITSSWIASSLTRKLDWVDQTLSLDARVVQLDHSSIIGYFRWRQAEAWRNHMHSHAFHALLTGGMSRRGAAEKLRGMKSEEIHEFMYQRGVNLGETPVWQRRGILVYRERYTTKGVDPRTGEETTTSRSRVIQDWEVPRFTTEEGTEFIEKLLPSP